jgi:hypothetical protein
MSLVRAAILTRYMITPSSPRHLATQQLEVRDAHATRPRRVEQ